MDYLLRGKTAGSETEEGTDFLLYFRVLKLCLNQTLQKQMKFIKCFSPVGISSDQQPNLLN